MRWRFDQPSPFLQTESQKLLLKMLSHPLLAVKIEAYERTLNLVKVRTNYPTNSCCFKGLQLKKHQEPDVAKKTGLVTIENGKKRRTPVFG